MFTNGLGDQGSIPGQVIPKTQKLVLDAALLSTQDYKVSLKGKVEQSWEWSNGNEMVIYILQSSRSGTSPSDIG